MTWRAAVLVTLALGGCGGSGSPPSIPDEPPVRGAVTGGTLTLGIWREPTSFLDAGIVADLSFAYLTDAPSQEGLLWYRSVQSTARTSGPAEHWQPWLAAEIPTLEDGGVRLSGCPTAGARMCVTWKLRDGVRWHDGHTLSSHDVCDTFRFFYAKYGDRNPTAIFDTSGWDQVLACTEPDRLTAVVDFRSQYGPYLGLGSGAYGILPSTYLDRALDANRDLETVSGDVDLSRGTGSAGAFRGRGTLDTLLDGTGPFVFAGREAGHEIVLVRNRNYWNRGHQPHLDRIVFKVLPDPDAEVAALASGDIDMGYDMRIDRLQALGGAVAHRPLEVRGVPDAGAEKIDLNLCAGDRGLCGGGTFSPYTADRTVRRAILMAIDRRAIIDRVAPRLTTVPKDSWMSLGAAFADDPSIPMTRYDPAGAERLLDRAGYRRSPGCSGGSGRTFRDGSCIAVNLGTTDSSPARLAIEAQVHDDLAKVGIEVIQPFVPNRSPDVFFAPFADGGPLATHSFDMALYANSLTTPGEPDGYVARYHGDCGGRCRGRDEIPSAADHGRGRNDTGENDPALDRLLDDARGTADLAARVRDYRKAGALLARDLPDIPLFRQVIVNAYSQAVRGVRDNEMVWDYNSYDWSCRGGTCQG